jgi:DNA processing protein
VQELNSKAYHVLLSMVEGIGPRWLAILTEIFGCPKGVWEASEKELNSVPRLPQKTIASLLAKRSSLDPEREIQKLNEAGIKTVFIDEDSYPESLREIYDPPKILYIRGVLEILQMPMLAIVGARKASFYGMSVAEKISGELVSAGLCVVSGLARGIDTAAHKGALKASGKTVAVLGCGVDVIYPLENKKLMQEVINSGVVISEYPPGTPPRGGNFPQRNRIISGLSKGVLIVEAAEKSGSLITADFALEQGREVFAVPGQVTNPLNKGAHRLIKQGAVLVEEAADILQEIGLSLIAQDCLPNKLLENLTEKEKKVYNNISDVPVNSEIIIDQTGLKASETLSILFLLEMNGMIRQLPGQRFVRCFNN